MRKDQARKPYDERTVKVAIPRLLLDVEVKQKRIQISETGTFLCFLIWSCQGMGNNVSYR